MMELTLNDFDFRNPSITLEEGSDFLYRTINDEHHLVLPSTLGTGRIQNLELRDDIHLSLHTFELKAPLRIDVSVKDDHLELEFCQSGNTLCRSYDGKFDFSTKPNQRAFCHHRDLRAVIEFASQQQISSITIRFSLDILAAYLQSQGLGEAGTTEQADVETLSDFFQRGIITPEMSSIIQQILNVPFTGSTKRIYLEGKALELIALHLEQYRLETSRQQRPSALRDDDIDRLYEAQRILIKDIQNPPSLNALARQAGLNEFKLKIGFRFVFGETVFGHLHLHRMGIARQLLKEKSRSIAEIANEVGYANLSYFASAFRRLYGMTPSKYRKY